MSSSCCRLRPLALVSLGLMTGAWHGVVAAESGEDAMEPEGGESPGDRAIREQRLAQATRSLMKSGLRLQPDISLPDAEWSAGVVMPVGARTQVKGGYVLEPAESEDGSEDWSESWPGERSADLPGHRYATAQELRSSRWQAKALLGVQHQWDVTPDMKLSVSYERMMGNSFGVSSVTSVPNRVKAKLDYRIRPQWQGTARLEQRVGQQENRMRLNARVNGQLSPTLTTQLRASHYRRTDSTPSTKVRVGISYVPKSEEESSGHRAGRRSVRDPRLETQLNYEYRQRRSTAHVLQAAATYRPNWRWQMNGAMGVRAAGSETAALAQVGMTHYLPNRLDVGGDVRWRQNLGGERSGQNFGATVELGYHINANLRVGAGYALGETKDRDFYRSQPSGPYVGLRFK